MKKTIAVIIIAIISIFLIMPNYIYAGDITSGWGDIYNGNDSRAEQIGSSFLGIAQIIGGAAAIICLLVMAIKFMIMASDPDQKAKIKEKLLPYLIGTILLFGATGIITLVKEFAQSMDQEGTNFNYNNNNSNIQWQTNRTCPNGHTYPEGFDTCPVCGYRDHYTG